MFFHSFSLRVGQSADCEWSTRDEVYGAVIEPMGS